MPTLLPNQPNNKKTLWQRIRGVIEKPPSTGVTLILGLVISITSGAVGTGAGYLANRLGNAAHEIPLYAFSIGGAGLSIGLFSAWLGTRLYYHLAMRTSTLELEAAENELAHLGHADKVLTRVEIYADHLYNLLEAFVADELSLHNPSSRDVKHFICETSEKYLLDATKSHFVLSIWGETLNDSDGPLVRAAGRVRESISDKVSDQVADAIHGRIMRTFEFLTGHIETEEEDAFAVRISSSWLKHHQEGEGDDEDVEQVPRRSKDLERFVYSADAPYHRLTEKDIKAWKSFGYKSVRAISFSRPGMICYLVVLSKEDGAFTEAEELYLLWLKRVLELDRVMHGAESSQSAVPEQEPEPQS